MKKRIEWLDICKGFGMFFIYLGHFGSDAGLAYPWVFSFHVPLFFFVSGLLENYNHRSFFQNLRKKLITILLPFFFFGILMTIIRTANGNTTDYILSDICILLKGGIRNTCVMAQGLWFLTCLFTIEILFSVLKKLKWKPIIFLICAELFFIAEVLITPKPTELPHWYWNLDSALYYMIYYCIGWLLLEPLERFLSSKDKRAVWGRWCIFLFSAFYSAELFFGKNIFLDLMRRNVFFSEFFIIVGSLLTIYMVVAVSQFFSQNLFIRKLGENSLYLCGNETLARLLVQLVLAMAGITVTITSPVQAYLYAGFLMVIVYKVLIPLEKPILSGIQNFLERSFRKYEEK